MTTDKTSLQILLVEDNLTDVLLLTDAFEELSIANFIVTHARRLDEAMDWLETRTFDAVLLDLGLPDSQGIATLSTMKNRFTEVPILVLSGLEDETVSVRAVQEGAQDYLVKGKIDVSTLPRTIAYAIERKHVEQQLIASGIGHRRLFEAAQDGIFILDGDTGQITDANPALEEMLGFSLKELYGRRLWEIPPFRERRASPAAFATLTERAGQRYQDLPLIARDGHRVDVEFVSSIYLVGNKKVIQCNIRDITARKMAEHDLNRFFTLSLNMLCIASPDGYFTRLNPAFSQLVGFTSDELMAKPFMDFVHPDDVPDTVREIEKLATGVSTIGFENRYRCQDGSYKWLTWTAAPHEGSLYCVAHDITALKASEDALRQSRDEMELRVIRRTAELTRSNDQLQQARDEAESANLAKSEFLSRMSHELRTPLNAILGFGQLLEMQELKPRAMEGVAHILRGGRHLLGLINEVLDITSIEAGRIDFSMEPIAVAPVVSEVIALMLPLAVPQNIQLVSKISEQDDPHLLADLQRFKQVLINLLSNAVKYNRQDGRVVVYCEPTGAAQTLRVSVTDTGRGLSPAEISRLFTPFERLGAAHTSIEGTGIGLALCRRLADAMNGEIGVESVVGQGSTFWIEFPAAKRRESGAAADEPASSIPRERQVSNRSILYIEDNSSNLRVVEMLLEHAPKLRLHTAMLGATGLDLAQQHHPDMILLDLHLPDLTGDEVLRRLRANPFTCNIPVVMLTADATPAHRDRLLAAGAQNYLTKPLNLQQLLQVVDETLAGNEPTERLKGQAAPRQAA